MAIMPLNGKHLLKSSSLEPEVTSRSSSLNKDYIIIIIISFMILKLGLFGTQGLQSVYKR